MQPQTPSNIDYGFWVNSPYLKRTSGAVTPSTQAPISVSKGMRTPESISLSAFKRELLLSHGDRKTRSAATRYCVWSPNPYTKPSSAERKLLFPTPHGTPGRTSPAWLSPSYPRTPKATPSTTRQQAAPFPVLAATPSSTEGTMPPPDFNTPSPFFVGAPSSSRLASPEAPTSEAVIDNGGEGRGVEEIGPPPQEELALTQSAEAPKNDMVEAGSPAIELTHRVHPQQGAADGGATMAGLDVRPFPASRDELLDLLQEGLHVQCLLPSEVIDGRIHCLSNRQLRANGSWQEADNTCPTMDTEDTYRRHILRRNHLDIERHGGVEAWVKMFRPSNVRRITKRKDLVVQGARAKEQDKRSRKKASGTRAPSKRADST